MRARWTHRLRGTALLNTAFAWEAVVDEVVFIVGPVLATFLATSIHPALGLATGAVCGLIGSLALAAQRGTEPPVEPGPSGGPPAERLSAGAARARSSWPTRPSARCSAAWRW